MLTRQLRARLWTTAIPWRPAVIVDGVTWTAVASAQGGLILRSQLLAAKVPRTTIDNWVSLGRLHRTLSSGLYRVAGSATTAQTRTWYAALHSRSPVSYLSAGRWWQMPVPDDGLVHITRLGRRRLDWPPGVRVHRVATRPDTLVRHQGLWVTTRAETVLDCVGWLSFGDGLALADRAVQQGWITTGTARTRLEGQPGRWGNRQLRRILRLLESDGAAESERRMHSLLRRSGFDGWVANFPFHSGGRCYEIDIADPVRKIAIEVDGVSYHSDARRFQADRTKQNALIAAGWVVLRFTWADIMQRPDEVIGRVAEVVLARSA